MFIQTPQDAFYVAATVAVSLVGVFLAIALYYLIVTLKHVKELTSSIKKGVHKVEEVVDMAREKLMGPSAWAAGIAAAVMKGIKIAQKQRAKKKKEQEEEDEE